MEGVATNSLKSQFTCLVLKPWIISIQERSCAVFFGKTTSRIHFSIIIYQIEEKDFLSKEIEGSVQNKIRKEYEVFGVPENRSKFNHAPVPLIHPQINNYSRWTGNRMPDSENQTENCLSWNSLSHEQLTFLSNLNLLVHWKTSAHWQIKRSRFSMH